MITITRRFEFDYGHRVLGHEGKCRHLHGHRGVAEVTVQGLELDSLGRVIDFSVLKREVGEWIDNNWDHNILLNTQDPLWQEVPEESLIFANRRPFLFGNRNPTAEYI